MVSFPFLDHPLTRGLLMIRNCMRGHRGSRLDTDKAGNS